MNKIVFLKLFIVFLLLNISNYANAVLPPWVLNGKIISSPVKIIAVVKKIELMNCDYKRCMNFNEAILKIEKIFEGPKMDSYISKFITRPDDCSTSFVGPQSFFNEIKKGDRVFITISSTDDITSYTIMTPELEDALIHHPGKIRAKYHTIDIVKEAEENDCPLFN